ncbi:major facilitator superfamily domain-containing protein [Tribonema minus]|uniref:Major facilitator superfamily domain-containing protein n=1 Tax=Tribonema minus TaxID=303371 RepID=A0A835Z685_9STRA|nr:major facilitator superfamily domain-containing protein [Tribonema minus]
MAEALEEVSGRLKYVLLLLTLIKANNHWSRYLINYLYAVSSDDEYYSLSAATGITEEQYGLLSGFGFSISYVLWGLVMGYAADLSNRVAIIALGLIIWSGANALMAAARGYRCLLAARALLGFGAAFSNIASLSLIADVCPRARLAEANGVYAIGLYAGSSLGSLSLVMAERVGWRNTCYAAALSGLLLAVTLFATVSEPRHLAPAAKPHADLEAAPPSSSTLLLPPPPPPPPPLTVAQAARAILAARPQLVLAITAAAAAVHAAGYVTNIYLPVFYAARFAQDAALYAVLNATAKALCGAASAYVGGRAADAWRASGQPRADLLIPAAGAAGAAPLLALALYAPSFAPSVAALALLYLLAECWSGPTMGALARALPPAARGTGLAAYTLASTVAGSAAVWAVGRTVGDSSSSGGADVAVLARAVAVGGCGAYAACAALYCGAALLVRADGYAEIPGDDAARNDGVAVRPSAARYQCAPSPPQRESQRAAGARLRSERGG